jgi:hypothetical protein
MAPRVNLAVAKFVVLASIFALVSCVSQITPQQALRSNVEKRDFSAARLAIAAGADVDIDSAAGTTPLNFAISRGARAEQLEFLLSNGANINGGDAQGTTPLMTAAANGNVSAIEYLLAHGADISVKNSFGETALFYTTLNDSLDAAKILLRHGVNINDANRNHETPLFLAAKANRGKLVAFFIENGADPNIKNIENLTALQVAQISGTPSQYIFSTLMDASSTRLSDNTKVKGSGKTEEMVFWQSIAEIGVVADYEAYLKRYPNGVFSALARSRIESFKRQPPGVANQQIQPVQTAVLDGKRVALVVGNSGYRNIAPLDNTINDAKLITKTLKNLGFEVVGDTPFLDLSRDAFARAIEAFGNKLRGADIAVFYYAGHGLQIQGTNFLVPIDANYAKPSDADFQLVDAESILRQMDDSGAKLKIIMLDACRNNPFAMRGLRGVTRGLAQMSAPEGTLISYATAPGMVAIDGEAGGDSPYTAALARAMQKRGIDVLRMFNEVALNVYNSTGYAQQPWLALSPIKGEFYFAGR